MSSINSDKTGVRIISSFTDYYDNFQDESGAIVWERGKISLEPIRNRLLKFMRYPELASKLSLPPLENTVFDSQEVKIKKEAQVTQCFIDYVIVLGRAFPILVYHWGTWRPVAVTEVKKRMFFSKESYQEMAEEFSSRGKIITTDMGRYSNFCENLKTRDFSALNHILKAPLLRILDRGHEMGVSENCPNLSAISGLPEAVGDPKTLYNGIDKFFTSNL